MFVRILTLVLAIHSGPSTAATCEYRLPGQPYTGNLSVSGAGVRCRNWTDPDPTLAQYTRHLEYPFGEANYCREASGLEFFQGRPWCFGVDRVSNVYREFCDVIIADCLNGGVWDVSECRCVCDGRRYGGDKCQIVLSEAAVEWPSGEYALPMTTYGCPEWSGGSHVGGVSVCMPEDLADPAQRDTFRRYRYTYPGPYRSNSFVHNICTKSPPPTDSGTESTDTVSWPPGSYCIYSVGAQCPIGFEHSRVTLVEKCAHDRQSYGDLPDISIEGGRVMVGVCCRHDGDTGDPMRLPTRLPFYLFQESSTDECQIVEGMRVTNQSFPLYASLVGIHQSTTRLTGHGNTTWIHLCYYESYAEAECYDPRDHGIAYRGTANVTVDGLNCTRWDTETECYDLRDHGIAYRGTANVTVDGLNCTRWDDSKYYFRPDRHSSHHYLGEENVNYCRLPEQRDSPWCYIGERRAATWGYCDVTPCEIRPDVSANLAMGRPVHMEPYSFVKGVAGLAVDGNTDTCVTTLSSPSPWIQVDLQELFEVHSLHVHINRDSPNHYGMRHFDVHVSPLHTAHLQRGALLCRHDVTVGKVSDVRLDCVQPIVGQYVTLQNTVFSDGNTMSQFANLRICEVQVFGIRTQTGIPAGLTSQSLKTVTATSEHKLYGHSSTLIAAKAGLYASNRHETFPHDGPDIVLMGGAWCAAMDDAEKAITVDLGRITTVHSIMTEGYDPYVTPGPAFYTSRYVVDYADYRTPTDDIVVTSNINVTQLWQKYKDAFGHVRTFEANTDPHTPVRNMFLPPFTAQYVRVKITEYVGWPCLRLELYIAATEQVCGGNVTGDTQLTSPNYPGYYGENLACTWHVTASRDLFISIEFKAFALAEQDVARTEGEYVIEPGNCTDSLRIYYHDVTDYILVRELRGEDVSPIMVSPSRLIKLEFVSCYRYSVATDVQGFIVNPKETGCAGCGVGRADCSTPHHCTTPCGVIASANYPNPYPHNLRCHWRISLTYGQYISLTFHKFDVIDIAEAGGVCRGDYLEIFDVDVGGTKVTSLGRMCSGVLEPDDVFSSWHRMDLEFTTDSDIDGRGFHVSYHALQYRASEHVLAQFNGSECGTLWHGFKSSCYRLFSGESMTWIESEAACVSHGGHLVGVGDRDEMSAIHYILMAVAKVTDPLVYIGVNDRETEGRFEWSDGQELTYSDWHKSRGRVSDSQPNGGRQEQCGVMDISNIYSTSHWHDIPCALDTVRQFMCEVALVRTDHNLPSEPRSDIVNQTTLASQWQSLAIHGITMANYFTCSNGEMVLNAHVCDSHPDCADMSDEEDCMECDTGRQYECTDSTCIDLSALCDYIIDCKDGADELGCVNRQCASNEWTCDSGQCVHDHKRCDVIKDCVDGSDEVGCLTCNPETSFQCYDGQCIPRSSQCDGQADCSGLKFEDEAGVCGAVRYKRSCAAWREAGYYTSGIYDISLDGVTPMKVECIFRDDSSLALNVFHHNLEDREYLDGWETGYTRRLIYAQASLTQLRQFVLFSQRCAIFIRYECFGSMVGKDAASITTYDGTKVIYAVDPDENGCNCLLKGNCREATGSMCSCDSNDYIWMEDFGNITDLHMLPLAAVTFGDTGASREKAYHTVGPLSCIEDVNMTQAMSVFSCSNGPTIHSSLLCLHQYNKYGVNVGCRDLSHLLDCGNFACPVGWYKCRGSFCVPVSMVCDGRRDCPAADDEVACDTYTCPGMYRCRGATNCVLPSELCDHNPNCLHGDDEAFCDDTCPSSCSCQSLSVTCGTQLHDIPHGISANVRSLDLRNNLFSKLTNQSLQYHFLYSLNLNNSNVTDIQPFSFNYLYNLRELNLGFNRFTILQENLFYGLNNLQTLILTGNYFIKSLIPGCFIGLTNIKMLNIIDTNIALLTDMTFHGVPNLEFLNLSSNVIKRVESEAFNGLYTLTSLDIRNNSVTQYSPTLLEDLYSLSHIYGDSYIVCCLADNQVSHCVPERDELSSCADLMSRPVLRISLWIVGTIALVGNLFVVLWRLRSPSTGVNGIIITNLAISDFLMGVYLYVIASADLYYRGRYVYHQREWLSSVMCEASGFLATLSIEASTMSIGLLTADRLTHIAFPLSDVNLSMKSLIPVLAVVWVLSVASAGVPLLPFPYFEDKFYSKTGACLPFQLSTNFEAGWEYSIILFMVFNSIIYIFVTFGYLYIYNIVKSSGQSSLSKSARKARNTEVAAARKMSLLVISNIVCWFPVFVIGVMVLTGAKIPGDIYAWVSVFVLPVNSAANPILYTISPLINFKNWASGRKKAQASKSSMSTKSCAGSGLLVFNTFQQELRVAPPAESSAKLSLEHVPIPPLFLARNTTKFTHLFGLSTREEVPSSDSWMTLSTLPSTLTWAQLYGVALSVSTALNNLDDSGLTVSWDDVRLTINQQASQELGIEMSGRCCLLQQDSTTKDARYFQNTLTRLARQNI